MTTSTVTWKTDLETTCTHVKSNDTFKTDAPVDNNGKGQHFSPTDLVATSLASCMLTIIAIRAQNEGWKIHEMRSDVQKTMASNPRRVAQIDVQISISGDLSDKERKKLELVAENCPVAKSLHQDLIQNVEFTYS